MTEKKKGIVMETDSGAVIVLTSRGEFLSVPWQKTAPLEVGSEIEFVLPSRKNIFLQQRTIYALAASLVLLILAVPFFYGLMVPNTHQVVAFVSVDINPSIEFGINELGIVLEAEALNEDGKRILENFQPINMDITEAIEVLANEAVSLGYIDNAKENNVVIAVSNPDKVPEKVKKLDNKIKDTLQKENIQSEASLIEVTGEIHDKAKSLGVSSGKYVILMIAAEEENLDISIDDIKKDSIVKAVTAAGGKPGQVLAKAREYKSNLREIQNRFEGNPINKKDKQGRDRGSVIANGSQQDKRTEESDKKPGPGERKNNPETENSRKGQVDQVKNQNGGKDKERLKDQDKGKDQETERGNHKERGKDKDQERDNNKDQEEYKDRDKGKDRKDKDDRDKGKDKEREKEQERENGNRNQKNNKETEEDKQVDDEEEKGTGDDPAQTEEHTASTEQVSESGNTGNNGNSKNSGQGLNSKSSERVKGKNLSKRENNSFIRLITKFFH